MSDDDDGKYEGSEMSEEELDNAASNYDNDINKSDIKEVADLLKMPSKKLH